MATKRVAFAKPKPPANVDAWVGDADTEARAKDKPAEPMKRFTIDVPESLHRRIKIRCAERGSKMADELRIILEREYGSS